MTEMADLKESQIEDTNEDGGALSQMDGKSHSSSKKSSPKISKRGRRSFPTRFQWVGEMYCLFLSCWKQGRFPICSLGPSWPYTIGLLCFAGMVLCFMVAMMFMIEDKAGWMRYVSGVLIFTNLALLICGILGDPGVKQETYTHYTKNWFSGGKDLYSTDSDEEDNQKDESSNLSDDEEETNSARDRSKKNTLSNRKLIRAQKLQQAKTLKYYQP